MGERAVDLLPPRLAAREVVIALTHLPAPYDLTARQVHCYHRVRTAFHGIGVGITRGKIKPIAFGVYCWCGPDCRARWPVHLRAGTVFPQRPGRLLDGKCLPGNSTGF